MKHPYLDGCTTSNDFTAMNKAIDIEVQKRNELSDLYSSQKNMNRSTASLYICAAICLLLVTGSFIYWLFFVEPQPPLQQFKPSTDNSVSLKNS
jgi:hypothetical protein